MRLKNIWVAFLTALLSFLLFPVLFLSSKLFFFSPFLVLLFYKRSYVFCLWASMAIGFIIDIFSSHSFLGIHALAYSSTTAWLYSQKKNFFADKVSTLPIMTFIFSASVTAFLFVISSSFERKIPLSPHLLLADFIVMPLFDSMYAYVFFLLPNVLLQKSKRSRNVFSSRRKRR